VKLLAYVPRNAPPGPPATRLGLLTDEGIRDLTMATGVRDVGELIDPDTVTVRAPIARPGKLAR
jgi:hypothetical protein